MLDDCGVWHGITMFSFFLGMVVAFFVSSIVWIVAMWPNKGRCPACHRSDYFA